MIANVQNKLFTSMKKNRRKIIGGMFLLMIIMLVQTAYAVEVPLGKRETGAGTMSLGKSLSRSSSTSTTGIPVTADLDNSELAVVFAVPVGIATITVEDSNGNIVYLSSIDTGNSIDAVIALDDIDLGDYKLVITYGKTILEGNFSL